MTGMACLTSPVSVIATTKGRLANEFKRASMDCLTSAILEIKDTILLEDRTKHGLDNNAWAWVGDEGRLLMQLLGEEVNTQVSVLASGR